jgi:heme exporter protein C
MNVLSRLETRGIPYLRALFRSSIIKYLTLLAGVASLGSIFGMASDSMYGVSNQINLIAYWHIGLATAAAVALTVTFLGCALYLATETPFWEFLAHSSGEVGFLMVTLTLVTGSVWGKVIWNSWWEWTDIRLVTFLVIWFIYAGYLLIYSAGGDSASLKRITSVYGIVGFVTVPLSYLSTRLWTPTFHRPTTGNPDADATITVPALLLSVAALLLVYLYLVGSRVQLRELKRRVNYARRDRTLDDHAMGPSQGGD